MLIDKMKTEITRFTWEATKDLGVADTTLTVGMPIWGTDYIVGVYGRVKTVFAGITGPVTVEVGITSGENDNVWVVSQTLATAAQLYLSPYFNYVDAKNWFCTQMGKRDGKYDSTPPTITFRSASGNLEDLTAGELEIVVFHLVPDK